MNSKKISQITAKIANEALSATEENIQYSNHTGTIDYNGTEAKVNNATFILRDGKIIWENGEWLEGT